MIQYTGTKTLNAKPMTRGAYNTFRGWLLPLGEDPNEAGYLVEYLDGGKPNHPDFAGYISWSPADVFQRSYRPTDTAYYDQAARMFKAYAQTCMPLFKGQPAHFERLDQNEQSAWIEAAKVANSA